MLFFSSLPPKEEIRQKEQEAAQAKEEVIVEMLAFGLLADEQIAELQNISLSHVQDINQFL